MSLRKPVRVLTLLAPVAKPRRAFCDRADLPVLLASVIAACILLGLSVAGLLP